jgi:hypothetical protein
MGKVIIPPGVVVGNSGGLQEKRKPLVTLFEDEGGIFIGVHDNKLSESPNALYELLSMAATQTMLRLSVTMAIDAVRSLARKSQDKQEFEAIFDELTKKQ